jgi:UDP-N-acetylglucosamine--N-acetylmuramyl-(pentapeptide) pyrophosphoryl-undecaprenol N-acetylglucosamine transferase
MALTWVIAGGGTGGHVTLGLALAEVMHERGDRVLFIGSDRSLEARLVPEAGFELVPLPSPQVMGRSIAGRISGVLGILRLVARARQEMKRVSADVVVSVGGYAAMPSVLAAALTRTPLAVVEPNAVPGRANRVAARFASRIFIAFQGAAKWLGNSKKIQCVGVPLRQRLLQSIGEQKQDDAEPASHLFVFGGSQGAKQINDAVIAALPRLCEAGVEIFHQAGEADLERVTRAYSEAGVDGQVVAFESDMPSRYRWADLAVCRAGALTLAELALAGLPALLVPYPHAADDHQTANARELEAAGAARLLTGLDEDAGASLSHAALELLGDPDALRRMHDAAQRWARPQSSREIIERCAQMLGAESKE